MGVFSQFSDSNEKDARNELVRGYNRGYNRAARQLNIGQRQLGGQYSRAIGDVDAAYRTARSGYDPYVRATSGAAGSYADAIGLGGAAGRDRAEAAFRTSPGYTFQVNQGLDAIDRRAASRGMLASGNTSIDTLQFAGGLADQEYGDYLNRLDAQSRFGADIAGATGDLAMRRGGATAGIRTDLGGRMLDTKSKLAGLRYETEIGKAGAKSDFYKGKDATGANIFGGITGGLSLGARLMGL